MVGRCRLGQDRSGAAAVEFAVVGACFFILVLLLIDLCWQVAVAAALESGARSALRWAATGEAAPGNQSAAGHVAELVLRSSGLPLQAAGLTVSVDSFPGFSTLSTPAAARSGLGGPGDVVRYSIVYAARSLTPLGQALLPTGLLQHHLVVLAKNEPYPTN
ncbi:TadE/TadG family type IV pilus assembly protein [Paeniroseomonas aquatica]|uniref:TadE-like domain-containing protein n=1 Tax=Paeniroseomonas aquatica TaxID=373043 RepID=A0ABT8AG12_9PROT|nr:TadE/TadG family type IV pilus assembly protein [Paeniroseomonas aquatica]MDN3568411.1 hypothetical protein [Paeniroseomonas aquatica]